MDRTSEMPENLPGSIRHSHRLREIAVQRMVEESARNRVSRALSTRTLPAAQMTMAVGDLVDFHRPPAQKDLPGWTGPATVTDMSQASRGIVKVNNNGRELNCSPKDLRRHMSYMCFLAAPGAWRNHEAAMQVIRRTVENITAGHLVTLGYHLTGGRYQPDPCTHVGHRWNQSPATSKHARCWSAIKHVAEVSLGLPYLAAARCGKGVPVLPSVKGYQEGLLITWQANNVQTV